MDQQATSPRIPLLFILHAYQPPYPVQIPSVIKRIVNNCYLPIAENLKKYPQAKIILNMNASLTEILADEAPDVLSLLSEAAERTQIEFLESGAYHPIFPLLEPEEAKKQLELNHAINKKYFGSVYNPKGVWPPELAIDYKSLRLFHEMGYSYSIAPNNAFSTGVENSIPYLSFSNQKFALLSRNRILSNNIAFRSYNDDTSLAVRDIINSYRDKPVILAMDIETFGEHHESYWNFLFNLLSSPKLKVGTFNEVLASPSWLEIKKVFASSWSTENHERDHGIPFPLWDHPKNPIHAIQHAHFLLLRACVRSRYLSLSAVPTSQLVLYMKSMHSCQFWWASGNGRWSPELIRKGFELQRACLNSFCHDEGSALYLNLSDSLLERLEWALQ